MGAKENVLAIDVGTQSTRALVFDAEGNLLDRAKAIYDAPYTSPEPGWAEQEPRHYWDSIKEACRELLGRGKVTADSLAGVSMTFQRATVVNLDQNGEPLRPAIVWLDQRQAKTLPRLPTGWRALFRLAGVTDTLAHLQAEAEVNWLVEHQPEIWDKTERFLFLSGYLTHLMTGEYSDSVACQVGYMPFDYKRLAWSRPSDWKWKAIPVPPRMLPKLVAPTERLGAVSATAAEHTGLPQGLPVLSGGSDKACEVLGSGCIQPGQGCIGYGTTATLNTNSPRYIEPIPLVPPYPSAQPSWYNLEFQIYRGFWMVTWFKEQFAQLEQRQADERGVAAETLLEELATEVPPGSLGLTLQPFWTPGVRHPGREGKGAIVGFGAAHHKQHLYRALLEGLAYGMREGRERIEKRTKTPLHELYVCGGGSRSDLVMQITADVFGMPARRPALFEASGLGAAMLAAVGAGLHPDLPTAVSKMARTGEVFEPDPEHVATYRQLYREVYRPLYGRLKPLYRSIMRITNYPEMP